MNPDKFVFSKKRLEFLGFELTEDGLEPGRELIKSILEFPRPEIYQESEVGLAWWNR